MAQGLQTRRYLRIVRQQTAEAATELVEPERRPVPHGFGIVFWAIVGGALWACLVAIIYGAAGG